MSWNRIIRFIGEDGQEHYGEPAVSSGSELIPLFDQGKLVAKELAGSNPFEVSPTGKELQVKTLLGPLRPSDVPIVRCIGLNYIKHSELASTWSVPHAPELFADQPSFPA